MSKHHTKSPEKSENTSETLSKEIQQILKNNSGLSAMFAEAQKNPTEIAVSAISGHQPSIDAVQLANELKIANVSFVGPDTGSEKEKLNYADKLAKTARMRLINKIDKFNLQLAKIINKQNLNTEDQLQVAELKKQIALSEEKLANHDFFAETEKQLLGDYAPVWLAVLRGYEGKYQAVVGGGDCPSAEFIKALLLGTSKSLGRLSSTYVLAGSKPEGMSANYTTKKNNGKIVSNRILAITDPAFEPEPGVEQRAEAAFATAKVLQELFPQVAAKIAFASYATGPSGKGPLVEKDREAYEVFKQTYPDSSYPAYGPIQFDAATNKQTAKNKLESFIRSFEQGKISKEELDAYELIGGLATIISVQNLEVGNNLVKGIHAAWNLSVEMGPLILPHDRISSESGNYLVASDLSRGEKPRSILSTLAALSILANSIQVE